MSRSLNLEKDICGCFHACITSELPLEYSFQMTNLSADVFSNQGIVLRRGDVGKGSYHSVLDGTSRCWPCFITYHRRLIANADVDLTLFCFFYCSSGDCYCSFFKPVSIFMTETDITVVYRSGRGIQVMCLAADGFSTVQSSRYRCGYIA